jgi:IPT/TIG domain-containing protein
MPNWRHVAMTVTFRGFGVIKDVASGWCRFALLIFVFAIASGSAHSQLLGPSITSLSPTSGPVESSVTITGSGFGSSQGTSTVKFNGTSATVVSSWSSGQIITAVPAGATTGNVVVTVSGVASNGKPFTVLPTPSITSLSPTSGAVGTSVTITGTNFGITQASGSSTVTFGGISAGTASSWSATSIQVTVPPDAPSGTVDVIVKVSGVQSSPKPFMILAAPLITGLIPTSGIPGTIVTLNGMNLGTSSTGSLVLNNTAVTVLQWTNSTIVFVVPASAGQGTLPLVLTSGQGSSSAQFTVSVTTCN